MLFEAVTEYNVCVKMEKLRELIEIKRGSFLKIRFGFVLAGVS
jgi:hypothetical protein